MSVNKVISLGEKFLFEREDLRRIKEIGKGNYGTVFLYKTEDTKVQFAIKTFKKETYFVKEKKALEKLQKAPCKNIPAKAITSAKVIVMPYLRSLEQFSGKIEWLEIIKQVHQQISCLKNSSLYYLDLKAENLLRGSDGTVYLGDLGGINDTEQEWFASSYAQEYQDGSYNKEEGFLVCHLFKENCKNVLWDIPEGSPWWWCSWKLGPYTQTYSELENKFKRWGRSLLLESSTLTFLPQFKQPQSLNSSPKLTVKIVMKTYPFLLLEVKKRIIEAMQCKELICLITRKTQPLHKRLKTFCEEFDSQPFSKSYEDVVEEFERFREDSTTSNTDSKAYRFRLVQLRF